MEGGVEDGLSVFLSGFSFKCLYLRPILQKNASYFDRFCDKMVFITTNNGFIFMKRLIYYDLLQWQASDQRKPLLLRGARQVGKTHVVRQLGENFSHFIEINFEKSPELKKIFEYNLDPVRIIRELSIALGVTITANKTLLFIDEIQEMPSAILALRYFYEEMPSLHVIAAGSLIEFAIQEVGVPVGRLQFLYLYPLSFIEYLCAIGREILAAEIINHDVNVPMGDAVHTLALRLLGEYMAIGGMPKVVQAWISSQDLKVCTKQLADIKNTYEQDFSKYARKNQIKYVEVIFSQCPRLIGKSFKYSHLGTDYKKRELEPALQLLEKAGLIYPVCHTNANGFPLAAEMQIEKFKLMMLDVGLNQAILGVSLSDWFLDPLPVFVNKGELAESFVGQELLAYSEPSVRDRLYYWMKNQNGSNAEVDYIAAQQNKICPVEIKSGHGASMQSMRVFLKSHPQSPYGIRFSTHDYSVHDGIHSYPLYAVSAITEDKARLHALIDAVCKR
jgi:predicted AAA+ superfamily ATPase